MNDENTDTPTHLSSEAQSEQTTGTIPCPKCDKTFSTNQALRMHNMRVHTGNTGYRWKARKTEAERLAYKREYQKKLRERYKSEGRNSRGYPLKKVHKWTPQQTAKFRSTMRRKAMQKAGGYKPERIQIVYPDPRNEVAQPVTKAVMRFCPYCGANVEKHII